MIYDMILTIVNLHLFSVLSKDHPYRSIVSLGINPVVVFPLPLPHTASSWHGIERPELLETLKIFV